MKSNVVRNQPDIRFQLLLRIKHPTLAAEKITGTLGIEPEHAATAGQSTGGKRRLSQESYWLAVLQTPTIREMSAWMGAHPPRQRVLSITKEVIAAFSQATGMQHIHLLSWLRKLDAQRSFFKRINDESGSITLVLQRANQNAPFTITPSLALQLAELGASLEID